MHLGKQNGMRQRHLRLHLINTIALIAANA
jgi:hypothetical protein